MTMTEEMRAEVEALIDEKLKALRKEILDQIHAELAKADAAGRRRGRVGG